MALSHFWNLLYIHRQKVVFIGLFLALASVATPALCQKNIVLKNNPGYDDKLMHYGFYLALPISRYNLQQSPAYLQARPRFAVNSKYTPNFATGFVINFHPFDYFNIRFTPGAGFYSRTVEYAGVPDPDSGEPTTINQEIGATMIELPLLIKYTSKRRKNVRMYLVAGPKASVDVSNRRQDRVEGRLRAESTDLSMEYGVGVDLFYPFFKFAPELRFSQGLTNMLVPDNNIYAGSLQKMTSNSITLILFFE